MIGKLTEAILEGRIIKLCRGGMDPEVATCRQKKSDNRDWQRLAGENHRNLIRLK